MLNKYYAGVLVVLANGLFLKMVSTVQNLNYHYMMQPALDGKWCYGTESLFKVTASLLQCSFLCSNQDTCLSFFHSESDKVCEGCQRIYLDEEAPNLHGQTQSRYYAVLGSCQDIGYKKGSPKSGNYKYVDPGSLGVVDIYCDFFSTYGYTFLSRSTLHHATNLSNHYTRSDQVIIRFTEASPKVEKHVMMSILSFYGTQWDIGVRLSNYEGYLQPSDQADLVPYIYLGFTPESFGDKTGTKQGYAAAGTDFSYTACNNGGGWYFAVFANINNLSSTDFGYACCPTYGTNVARQWIDNAVNVPAIRALPTSFYFTIFGMHMGGCGAWVTQGESSGLDGVTFGLRFDLGS